MSQSMSSHVKSEGLGKLKNYLSLLRLSHWSKAIFVLIGCIYSAQPNYFIPALWASLAFCLIASAVYIYNDIEDRSEDSLHPRKSNRPLASDQVTVYEAIFLLIILLVLGLSTGLYVSKSLCLILMVYLAINVAYNHVLKLVPVFDVLCIAMGFMLRVFAGTIGIGLPLSIWLTIAATLLSLYIALAKRRLELHLDLKQDTRKVLRRYNSSFLKWSLIAVGSVTFLTYVLYIAYVHQLSFNFLLTLPFAAFALWRFYWLSENDVTNDDPVSVMLCDRISRLNLIFFSALTFVALYQ